MKSVNCMRIRIIIVLLSGSVLFSSYSTSNNEKINFQLNFSGLDQDDNSRVMIAVYIDSKNFLGDEPYKTFEVPTSGKTNFSHEIVLPKGEYGMAFFQDLNGDDKLNKNFVGYPTEPFTFSNNAPANFGPPKWSDAVFILDKDRSMDIQF